MTGQRSCFDCAGIGETAEQTQCETCSGTGYVYVMSLAEQNDIRYLASFLDGYKAPEQIGSVVWDIAATINRIAGKAVLA